MNRLIWWVGTLIIILVGSLLAHTIIIGRAGTVALTFNPVAWQTDQSFDKLLGGSYLPIPDLNYTPKVTYFDGQRWAVGLDYANQWFSDPTTLVLRQTTGGYTTILGPSSTFTSSDLGGIPSEVVNYLDSQKGLVSGGQQP